MTTANSENMMEEEKALITAIVGGESHKFEQLVVAYQQRIFVAMVGILGNRQDAEDVTQDAFVTAFRKIQKFEFRSSFYTWLHRIAWNLAIDFQRQRGRRRNAMHVEGDHETTEISGQQPTPDQTMLTNETIAQVQKALMQIDEERRHVIILRDLQGLDYAEIASLLDIPIGTVRSRLHRARLELREVMMSSGMEPESNAAEQSKVAGQPHARNQIHAGGQS